MTAHVQGQLRTAPGPTDIDIEPGAALADTWQVWIEVNDPRYTPLVRVVHRHDPTLAHLLTAHVGRPIEIIPASDHPRLGRPRDWIHADALHPRTTPPPAGPPAQPARIPAKVTAAVAEQYVHPIAEVMAGRRQPATVRPLLDPRLRGRYPNRIRPVAHAHTTPDVALRMQASYPRLEVAAAVTIDNRTHPLALGLHTADGNLHIDTIVHPGLNLTVRTKPVASATKAPAVATHHHRPGHGRTRA